MADITGCLITVHKEDTDKSACPNKDFPQTSPLRYKGLSPIASRFIPFVTHLDRTSKSVTTQICAQKDTDAGIHPYLS